MDGAAAGHDRGLRALPFFTMANLFIRFYEEPTLRAQFGESYVRYTQCVGRWLPRFG